MEHLFTEKGKKYAVINKVIGTGQIICREVMINKDTGEEVLRNDVETLSESLLYNSPVESYYDKRERELKLSFEKIQSEYNQKTDKMYRLIRSQDEINKDFFEIRERFLNFCKSENEPFIQLVDYLTGNFEYAFIESYKAKIYTKEELFEEMKNSDGMKGLQPRYSANGEEYRKLFITSYNDGSGSTHDEIYLYKTEQEAKDKFKDHLLKRLKNQNYFNIEDYLKCLEYGIEIPSEKIEKQIESAKEKLKTQKEYRKRSVDSYQKDLDEWKELLKKLKS